MGTDARLPTPDSSNRDTASLPGWINELGLLSKHPHAMPHWIRSALRTIYQGLSTSTAATRSPNFAPADVEAMNARQAVTIRELRAQLAALKEADFYFGAQFVGDLFVASVMRKETNGTVTVVASSTGDRGLLYEGGCFGKMKLKPKRSAIDALGDSVVQALDEAPISDVLSVITGTFVSLVAELTRRAGHDADEQIKVDGGDERDITIHAVKAGKGGGK